MKFNKIILSNIGAYHGHYELDLSVNHPKKILVLFGGKNGAGKTTLLESFRLALFGPYTYGLRTESEQYHKRIRSLLNKNAVSQGETNFRIILEFDKVENYVRNTYTIKRSWSIENTKPKETLEVLRDGQYLSEREKENFQAKLREDTPPQLFELCLFDGEEISRIINDNRLPEYLKNSARVLFNLDLFENLEQDISQYVKQSKANGTQNEFSDNLNELETNKEDLLKIYDKAVNKLNQTSENLAEKKDYVDQLKRDFEIHGGLVKEERDSLIQEINGIEHKRRENMDRVRSFITGLLPIFLTKQLLSKVNIQMKNEQEFESFNFIKENLTAEKLKPMVTLLSSTGIKLDENNKSINEILVNGFFEALQPADNKLIHRASFNQRSEVVNLVNQLERLDEKEYLKIFNENQSLLARARDLRKQVEENDKNHDFKDLLDQIQIYNLQIEKWKVERELLEENIKETKSKIDHVDLELEKLKVKIIESAKSENTLSLSLKITEVSKKFRSLQLQKKLQQVEIEATYMANQLFRKEDFLKQIKINPNTFELTLLSPQGEEVDQFNISAGEKELLLLSIFWAMFKTSGHRLPFIFDTLLGRLDKTHKQRLLTELIPRCGEQVLILSTDSEIDKQHFELILPILSKAFTLDYDKEERRTKVFEDKYFNLFEMELKK
jgi:DNA sulfur modification protein DndD